MPTYEFVCLKCGASYEVTCAISQRERASCPGCGSTEKRQNYKASAVITHASRSTTGSLPAASCG